MDFKRDISQIPKPILIGGALVVALLLFFLADKFFHFLPREDGSYVEKLKPPPGYPDVPPYNTKPWLDMYKRQQQAGGGAAPPAGAPR